MGTDVYKEVKKFVKKTYYVQQLPHPAGRSFRADHYKPIYFWGLTRALHKAGIINTDEGCELARLYLDKYDERQFVEYGKLSGEFEYMNEISSTDIDCYCNYHKTDIPGRIQSILERVANDVDFTQYGLISAEHKPVKKDGRRGWEFLHFKKRNDYEQWFFYGIYYDTKNHGIPFKKGVHELAFFFDINVEKYPKCREQLFQNCPFIDALGNLEELGFKENLTKTIGDNKSKGNKWRLLFKRVPLTELGNFSYQDVKKRFEEILSQLRNEEAFYQEMMAPPE